MSETYVECLVKSQAGMLGKLGKILLIMLTVAFGLLTILGVPLAFFVALITGFGAYFVSMYTDIEFEYLYLDKELTVDKVMGKTRRKRQAVFEVERLEILAPIKSHHLDGYRNRDIKAVDYSIRLEEKPDLRYVMFYNGNKKVILSPSVELVKAIRNVAPRKVFLE